MEGGGRGGVNGKEEDGMNGRKGGEDGMRAVWVGVGGIVSTEDKMQTSRLKTSCWTKAALHGQGNEK